MDIVDTHLIVVLAIALVVIVLQRSRDQGHPTAAGRGGRAAGQVPPDASSPARTWCIPVFDRVRYTLDMREAVVPFPPQGVITEDNLMVSIDSVIYFQILDPVRAAYEAQDYIKAIEQLTMTTLRNIIGGLDLEQTLTSREEINQKLRVVLDEATGKWGIKVNRVELRAIEPPATIRDAMEKGARAERDKRASILIAEGQRQSQILSAGGEKESSILRAQGDREAAVLRAQADRQAQMLRAEGEAQAISTVFERDPRRAAGPGPAGVSVHADAAHHRARRLQQGLDRAERDQRGARRVWAARSARLRRPFPSVAKGEFRAPEKIDVQAEIPQQDAEEVRGRPDRPGGHRRGPGARGARRDGRPSVAEQLASLRRAATVERPRPTPHSGWPIDRLEPRESSRTSRGDLARALAVFAAGSGAGLINTVVGTGTLITFPMLLALGCSSGRRQRVEQDRAGARLAVGRALDCGRSWSASAPGSSGTGSRR